MPRPEDVLTAGDFDRVVALIEELSGANRTDEATAVYKLIVAAEEAGLRPPVPDESIGSEGVDESAPGDDDLAAGRIIPHDVMAKGVSAIEDFRRRREVGDVDEDTAAAILLVRREVGRQLTEHA